MKTKIEHVVYFETNEVVLASNRFIDVPIILQYEKNPLIWVEKSIVHGHMTGFKLFHPDGTDLGVVKGPRLYLTKNGAKAGLVRRHFPDAFVCEREGKTLFEVRKDGAAAVSVTAELNTDDGAFVRSVDGDTGLFSVANANCLSVGSNIFTGNTKIGSQIGIHFFADGSVKF